ncbi:MAG: amidohydrolase family protein [Gemmatimonadaceae bacterium]|nr:amidohydrolase family protein [Gemmatimonadaceae bacterium]NUO96194.1 amidohydrolase family protein [Gemmatimonadaceae bacterium]NUP69865.1 amidohydrolase family protein [Gemmatimonadaceae bacterium]
MMRPTLVLAAALAAAPALGAQTIAITGGKVYPVSGPVIENGTVVIRGGEIVAVGSNVAVPADAQRIDATGKVVTPGLVNAATQLTLVEIGAVGATREAQARGREGIAAAFRPWEGLNPTSVLISPARNAGVTTVLVAPSGGLISGQAGVVHLVPGTAADMVLKAPVAMVASLGPSRGPNGSPRAETIMRLREILDDARVYRTRRADFERAQTRTLAAGRLDLEAMLQVLDGRIPMVVEADKASDIEAAMKLAKDYNFRLIVAGGAEGWQIADKLAAARIPVLTGAMNNIPESFSSLGQRQENAGLLSKAGVQVTVVGNAGGGDEEAFNVRNVRFEAGNAVAYGMDWNTALRSITLTPAETFGVADRVGSLAAGKVADVVIWSGDPLDFASQPEHVFVRGQEIRQPSRQDLLEERYKTLPPSYRRP